jgi:hypothetical protein
MLQNIWWNQILNLLYACSLVGWFVFDKPKFIVSICVIDFPMSGNIQFIFESGKRVAKTSVLAWKGKHKVVEPLSVEVYQSDLDCG